MKHLILGLAFIGLGLPLFKFYFTNEIKNLKLADFSLASPSPFAAPSLSSNPILINKNSAKKIAISKTQINVLGESKQNEVLSPVSLAQALNNLRSKSGVSSLNLNQKLSDFAKKRADFLASEGKLDNHSGFFDFLNKQDGFVKLGFFEVGENSSEGYTVSAFDLIEKIYGTHSPHREIQLDSKWTDVGIGVNGTFTDFVFAGKKR